MDWLKLVSGIATVALGAAGGPAALLVPFVVHGIQVAQAAHQASKDGGGPGLSGPEKLALAHDEILNGVTAWANVAPGHVDPTIVDDAFMHTVSDIVDASKIVGQAKAGTAPHASSDGGTQQAGLGH